MSWLKEVVFDDNDGMTFGYQCIERLEQGFDVVKMKSRSGFVEYKNGRFGFFVGQE